MNKSKHERLSRDEELAVFLTKAINKNLDSEVKGKILSLQSWFIRNHSFTDAQYRLGMFIVSKAQVTPKERKRHAEYYLYAISSGSAVKLGYSSNIKKRLQSLQTGHEEKLQRIWSRFVGSKMSAKNNEKLIHKKCKDFAIIGEWFKLECLPIVFSFKPKSYESELTRKSI